MKLELGNVYVTNGVGSLMNENEEFIKFVNGSLKRHSNGDWGDLCKEDKELNDLALTNGDDRILSRYNFTDGDIKIYIITEWDRKTTTILFPEEY